MNACRAGYVIPTGSSQSERMQCSDDTENLLQIQYLSSSATSCRKSLLGPHDTQQRSTDRMLCTFPESSGLELR